MLASVLISPQKQVLLALFLLAGFSGSIIAGSRGTQEGSDDALPQSAGVEAEENGVKPANIDESIRLRQDLEIYSRNVDPAHVQIEERRRVMRKKIMERFLDADTDHDGSISLEEATEPLPQVARRFSRIDLNGDNVITLDELEVVMARDMERGRVVVVHSEAPEVKQEATKSKGKQTAGKSKETVASKRSL